MKAPLVPSRATEVGHGGDRAGLEQLRQRDARLEAVLGRRDRCPRARPEKSDVTGSLLMAHADVEAQLPVVVAAGAEDAGVGGGHRLRARCGSSGSSPARASVASAERQALLRRSRGDAAATRHTNSRQRVESMASLHAMSRVVESIQAGHSAAWVRSVRRPAPRTSRRVAMSAAISAWVRCVPRSRRSASTARCGSPRNVLARTPRPSRVVRSTHFECIVASRRPPFPRWTPRQSGAPARARLYQKR